MQQYGKVSVYTYSIYLYIYMYVYCTYTYIIILNKTFYNKTYIYNRNYTYMYITGLCQQVIITMTKLGVHHIHHVPKCLSYHKSILVITRRVNYIKYVLVSARFEHFVCCIYIYTYIYTMYIYIYMHMYYFVVIIIEYSRQITVCYIYYIYNIHYILYTSYIYIYIKVRS